MSEIKVNSIKGVNSTDAAITINNSDGTCTANITNNLSNRNKIYNGKMDVDQRNSGSSVTLPNNLTTYVVDRFSVQPVNMDEATNMTAQQVSDSPDGFAHSLKVTTNTAESSIASNEFVSVYQKMEGQDFQDLAYNTSGAKDITMSFYVKSSITGTFSFTVYRDEPGTDRIVNKTYTINSANTWERKVITIAGDTGRAIQNTNGSVWWNIWHLAAGSDYDSTISSGWQNYATTNWAGGHAQDGVVTTAGATWQITGVQLETNSVATDFEHRPFGQELSLCQRYFYQINGNNGDISISGGFLNASEFFVLVDFPVTMRATPSYTGSATAFRMVGGADSGSKNLNNLGLWGTGLPTNIALIVSSTSGGTAGHSGAIQFQANNGFLQFSAEL